MSLVLVLSIGIELAALVAALIIWLRLRDRWFIFLGTAVALLALRNILTISAQVRAGSEGSFATMNMEELPGLAVSLMAFAAVLVLRRLVIERRDADESLSEGEQRFRDLIDASVDRYWEMDESLRFTYAVDQSELTIGPSPAAILGRTRWDAAGIDPDATEKWRRHRADLEAHRPFRDFRFSVRDDKGRLGHWRVSGKPIFDSEGNFRGYRGTSSEETEHVRQREQSNRALRESEARAARARSRLFDSIEAMTEGFALYDSEDRHVACNEKYREMYSEVAHLLVPGVTFETQIRESAMAGEIVEAIGREEAWIAERMDSHLNPAGPHEQQLSDGRWLKISERRTKDGGVVGVRTDITALKEVEQALRESEARLRDFAEAASDWFWESDAEHRFTFVSRAGVEEVGLRFEDVIGKVRYELPDIVGDPADLAINRADLEARRPFRNFQYARRIAEGRIVHFRISGRPRFDADGVFLGYRGVGSEISAEIEAEEKRRAAEIRLARAIETVPAAFTLFDAEDRLVAFNKVNQAVYERPDTPMVPGVHHHVLVRAFAEGGGVAGTKADADAWIRKRLNRRKDPARAFEFRRSDDSWIEINDYILEDGSLISVGLNITERKRSEQVIRQREAELAQLLRRSTLDEMASVMAHELNQPLSAMVNYANGSLRRMRAALLEPGDLNEIMTRISEQAQRASDVLRKIGGFVGQSKPERGPVDMSEIVNAVATMLAGQLQASQVRLQIDLEDDAGPVLVDRIEIEQVLLNLAKNAIEAMEETPADARELRIRTRSGEDGDLEVIVSDTGPGFDKGAAGRIFEPFVTSKENGMGMGLSISRTIVEAHGGRIRIDRRGKGGTVRLTLPFDREALDNVA